MSIPPAFDAALVHPKPVILAIFIITYVGIALGHVPGLKLNRVGMALLGAIAMMIFGGIGTANVISFVNWPTILLLFGFFVISAQLRLSGFYDRLAGGISARLGHPARFLLVLMVVTASGSPAVTMFWKPRFGVLESCAWTRSRSCSALLNFSENNRARPGRVWQL